MAQLSGVALIDKPVGPTSHDVVYRVRRAVGQKRVGHAGTLDPLASGLLVVCIGRATRIAEYLLGHDKTYEVEALLGAETDTLDAEGKVIRRWQGPLPTDESVEEAVASLRGDVWQEPPTYSAVKVDGQPLYRLARKGRPRRAAPRRVRVDSLVWRRIGPDRIALRVECSAGTYVRSLVRDIGRRLDCGAYVTALRRTASGPFSVGDALSLEEALSRLEADDSGWVLDPLGALPHVPRVSLEGDSVRLLLMGQEVEGPPPEAEGMHIATGPDGAAVALVEWSQIAGLWRPKKVLSQECSP